jgi:hypothetical protein
VNGSYVRCNGRFEPLLQMAREFPVFPTEVVLKLSQVDNR